MNSKASCVGALKFSSFLFLFLFLRTNNKNQRLYCGKMEYISSVNPALISTESSHYFSDIYSHPIPSILSKLSTLLAIMAQELELQALLSLTKSQYRLKHPSPAGRPYDKIVVGAVIFHPTASPHAKILLLKRAAKEVFYPNIFEIPGGHVEDTDADIFQAVAREVHEETALSIDSVKASIESFAYITEKSIKRGEEEIVVQKSSLQLNLVFETTEDTFRVNPEEHSEGMWAAKEEIGGLKMTEEMRLVVENAFRWRER